MSTVTLRKVKKSYGTTPIVHGIDLDIEKGEFVVLLGPSGCGKTTTLRMVAGLEDISDGEISIGGRVVNHVAPKDRKVAMVFQNYALYPHMTVRQNMEFALKPQKLAPSDAQSRVRRVSEMLGLHELLERRPAQLSGGQRQRVAMGRAMVRTPEVFLFDEPLSNLDAKLRTQVRLEIQKLHQRLGTTVIYVTHDQVEAMTLADKIVIMKEGHIAQAGTPKEVFAHPKNVFVATFIGSPAMNLVPMRAHSSDGSIELASASARLTLPVRDGMRVQPGMEVLLGVRPNDVHLVTAGGVPANASIFDARVEVTEYLGVEALLDLRLGEHEILAQVPAAEMPDIGSTVKLWFDPQALHVFDALSGDAVY